MTKKEIIYETVEWYKTHPRSVRHDEYGHYVGCYYFYPGRENTTMCAVGRCIDPLQAELIKLKDINDSPASALSHIVGGLDKVLKEQYRGHSENFWDALQELHDMDSYWDKKKLSTAGLAHMAYLLTQ